MPRFTNNPFDATLGFGRKFIKWLNQILRYVGEDMDEQQKQITQQIRRIDEQITSVDQPQEIKDLREGSDGTWYSIARERFMSEFNDINHELEYRGISAKKFGAQGNGVADDWSAITTAIQYALDNGHKKIIASGIHAISKPILLDDLPKGFELDIQELKPTDVFTGQSLIIFGSQSTFEQRQVKVTIQRLDGVNRKVNGIHNRGLSYSDIYVGNAENMDKFYYVENPNFLCCDISLNGNLVNENNYGFYMNAVNYHCENTRINYNFIANNAWGGIYFREGCGFQYVNSALDFNGKGLVEIEVDVTGNIQTDNTITGQSSKASSKVVATYRRDAKYYVLAKVDTLDYRVGEVISNGTKTATILSLKSGKDNTPGKYFDIINEKKSASFSRNIYICSYVDNIVGEFINTDKMFIANTYKNRGTNLNGLGTEFDPINRLLQLFNNDTNLKFLEITPEGDLRFHPDDPSKNIVFKGRTSIQGKFDVMSEMNIYKKDWSILGTETTNSIGIMGYDGQPIPKIFLYGQMVEVAKDLKFLSALSQIVMTGTSPELRVVKDGGGNIGVVNLFSDLTKVHGIFQLKTYKKNELPDVTKGYSGLIFVGDATGGPAPAYSDGLDWRSVKDGTIIN